MSFEPGSAYDYADTNYVILGHLIEAVTGNRLADELEQRLFAPLGLTQTILRDERALSYLYGEFPCSDLVAAVLDETLAASLEADYCDTEIIAYPDIPHTAIDTFDAGASGLITSAPDLLRWANALFAGEVVPDVEQMLPEGESPYGLGISGTQSPIGAAVGHVGGGGFGEARMWHIPEHDVTLVAWATQTGDPNLGWLVDMIWRAYDGEEVVIPRNVEEITAQLDDADHDTRREAVIFLMNIGPPAAESRADLIDLLQNDPSERIRAPAALALGSIARQSNDAEIINVLEQALLTDESELVRERAAVALGAIGPDALPIFEAARDGQSDAVLDAIDLAISRLEAGPN